MNFREFLELLLFLSIFANVGLFLIIKKYKNELWDETNRSCKFQLRIQELRTIIKINKETI